MTDIGELSEQIRNSDALKTHYFLNELYVNHYVVARNFQELQTFLETTEDPDTYQWVAERKDLLHQAMHEVTRLLLNYISSAKARIDNSRNMIRKRYEGKPFFESYNQEIALRFRDNLISEFIEGLRNYSVHYSLPFAGAHWQYTADTETQPGSIRQFFTLSRERLLSSGFDWSKKGLPYLESAGKEIVIREFTTEYFEIIRNFDMWIEQELNRLHKEELDWLYTANARVRAELDQMRASQVYWGV